LYSAGRWGLPGHAVFFLQAQAQKVFHRLRSVFKKRFSSFLKRVAFAGSRGWRGFQRTFFGLFWQTPG